MRAGRELWFLAVIDALIGLAYLLLDSTYYQGRGLRIPTSWWSLQVWGVIYLAVATAIIAIPRILRITLSVGVAINAAFSIGLLWAFATGFTSPALHSSPVGGLLLLGWAARHYFTGRSTT